MNRSLFALPILLLGLSGCAIGQDGNGLFQAGGVLYSEWAKTKGPSLDDLSREPAAVLAAEGSDPVQANAPEQAEERGQAAYLATTNRSVLNSSSHQAPLAVVANDNQCWVQSVIRPMPVKAQVDVVVKDGFEDYEVIPTQLADDVKTVVVKDGATVYRVEPPVYREVTEQVLIKPEFFRTEVVPAVFEDAYETVEVEAARTELDACKAAGVRFSDSGAARTLCARLIPAKTLEIKVKRLVRPASTREVLVPAEYKQVTRWVLERPSRAIPVDVVAQTRELAVKNIAEPERVATRIEPEQRRRLNSTQFSGQPQLVTVPAVCDHELNEGMITAVQRALSGAGHNPGAIDGKLGKQTIAALLDFQYANGLAYGALTHESLDRLGVGK